MKNKVGILLIVNLFFILIILFLAITRNNNLPNDSLATQGTYLNNDGKKALVASKGNLAFYNEGKKEFENKYIYIGNGVYRINSGYLIKTGKKFLLKINGQNLYFHFASSAITKWEK
jgi:hypothetical protein